MPKVIIVFICVIGLNTSVFAQTDGPIPATGQTLGVVWWQNPAALHGAEPEAQAYTGVARRIIWPNAPALYPQLPSTEPSWSLALKLGTKKHRVNLGFRYVGAAWVERYRNDSIRATRTESQNGIQSLVSFRLSPRHHKGVFSAGVQFGFVMQGYHYKYRKATVSKSLISSNQDIDFEYDISIGVIYNRPKWYIQLALPQLWWGYRDYFMRHNKGRDDEFWRLLQAGVGYRFQAGSWQLTPEVNWRTEWYRGWFTHLNASVWAVANEKWVLLAGVNKRWNEWEPVLGFGRQWQRFTLTGSVFYTQSQHRYFGGYSQPGMDVLLRWRLEE